MTQDDTNRPRIYLGPEAIKLATSSDGKATTGVLEERIHQLQMQIKDGNVRVQKAQGETAFIEKQNAAILPALDAVKSIAQSTVDRSEAFQETSRILEKHLVGLANLQLHVSGLIGLKLTDNEDHQALVKDIQRIHGALEKELNGRAQAVLENDRANTQVAQKVIREVNDARAAIESNATPELELTVAEQGGHER